MSRKKPPRLLHTMDNVESNNLASSNRCPAINPPSVRRKRGRLSLASLILKETESKAKIISSEKNESGKMNESVTSLQKENISFRGPVTRTRNRMTNQDISDLLLPHTRKKRKHFRGRQKLCPICGVIHSSKHTYHCVVCYKAFMLKRSQQNHHYLFHGITEGMSLVHIKSLASQKKKKRIGNEENKFGHNEKQKISESNRQNTSKSDTSENNQPAGSQSTNQDKNSASEADREKEIATLHSCNNNSIINNSNKQLTISDSTIMKNFVAESSVQKYTGQHIYHCIVCDKSFKWKRSQQNHQYMFHDISEGMSQVHIRSLAVQKRKKQGLSEEHKTESNKNDLNLIDGNKFNVITDKQLTGNIVENKGTSEAFDSGLKNIKSRAARQLCYSFSKETSRVSNQSKVNDVGVNENEASKPSPNGISEEPSSQRQNNTSSPSDENELRCDECCRQFRSPYSLYFHRKTVQHRIKADYAQGKPSLSKDLPDSSNENNNQIKENGNYEFTEHGSPVVEKQSESEENISCKEPKPFAEDDRTEKNNLSRVTKPINDNIAEQKHPEERIHQNPVNINENFNECYDRNYQFNGMGESGHSVKNGISGSLQRLYYQPQRETLFPSPPSVFLPNSYMLASQNPNDKHSPLVWESVSIQSEKVLVTKLEGIHPGTEQHYFLYKCCICGSAFPGLENLCNHLLAHSRNNKEHNCEKCGAVFKWRSQLEVHEQVHRVVNNKLASMATSLPSSYVFLNPFNNMGIPMMMTPLSNPTILSEIASQSMSLTHHSPSVNACHEGPNFLPPSVVPPKSMLGQMLPNPASPNNEIEKPSSYKRLRRHRQKYPFLCSYCSKSFDRVFSLQRHERIHTGIKPCFCRICGRGFSEKRNLRHHIVRFHSENNQRDIRRRVKAAIPRSNSLKLVSFLKRTAVRILNSIDQSKLDSQFSEKYKIIVPPSKRQTADEKLQPLSKTPSEDISSKQTTPPETSPENEKVSADAKSNESVVVVIPTEVPDNSETTPSQKCSITENDERQVLEDPKRSLIANRRKGKPFKYTPSQGIIRITPEFRSSNNSICPPTSDAETDENIASVDARAVDAINVVSEKDTVRQEGMKEEPYAQTAENINLETNAKPADAQPLPDTPEMTTRTISNEEQPLQGLIGEPQLAKENENPLIELHSQHPTFKERLRGHGAFFSSYNPRLGVVDKPVARAEACKPQVGPDGRYVYPCSYCLKAFCSMSDLNRHMDFHEDIRPFKCPFCSYSSRTNSQLKVHMMRHQGIKQFLCHICNYNGVTQSDLNRHCRTRTHILRVRNICSTCGLGFYTKTHLDGHILLFHRFNSQMEAPSTETNNQVESNSCSDLAPLHSLATASIPFDIYNMPAVKDVTSCAQQSAVKNNSTSGETNNNDCCFNSKHATLNS